ncbi:hydroxyisourate hydrolase [Actinocrinis puniceicyclus]|uniref:5-hydroxyisourate hydrolase n=1 Tax=Actinocrinis puniceicyclus TaxID=977794 RepID=A0A8J7WQQ4_9ACTN|nr:hydroxyisourate hydrolase [Actinocrinis puniceicyclus]MBS2965000.1 hydroxyisourate hydrolase [Actinocrinis puniceicyclus]
MASLSTHVLDAALGRPAAALTVRLDAAAAHGWSALADGRTDPDGRVREAFGGVELHPFRSGAAHEGRYRLVFDTAGYFARRGVTDFFYPEVAVCFTVGDAAAHYHVPLLLSPFAYSTYRGS